MGDGRSRSDRFDAYQQRHSVAGFIVGVVYKVFDDRAPYLAALVTYYAFVSIFPLLLLFISIMGFVLQSDPSLRQSLENSAIAELPGIGTLLRENVQGLKGSGVGVALGFIGLVYGALGAMQASQYAFNVMYAVPRNEQPNPLRSRVRSLGVLLILGSAIVVSTGLNVAIANARTISSELGTGLTVVGYLAGFLVNVGLFCAAFRVLSVQDLRWREVLAGGIISATLWEVLQTFGSRFIVHQVRHGTALYGVFGVVLVTLAWIYLVALGVMVSAEINVVWHRRLWPRSIRSPFTDDMQPTPADLAAYASYARAPRFKRWQRIDVSFDPPEQPTGDGVTPPV